MLSNFQGMVSKDQNEISKKAFFCELPVKYKSKFFLSFPVLTYTQHNFHQHVGAKSRETIPYRSLLKSKWRRRSINNTKPIQIKVNEEG